ncbi:hypothetical protein [Wolbachia endosymbiont of Encarsia formosa]|uniref:hypothetical protein n=1 Tax=Wolbachia endosymbiont of Encarsia formosa TaxID=77125 RepID=UPI0031BAAEB1
MNYNFSSSPRVGSCIPTRTAYTTDPRYHNNFDLHCHNHFNPHCHDHFYPYYDEVELNIHLPDVKCPDVTVLECPACPDVKCPDVPPCPDVKCPDIPPCPDVIVPECPACPEPKKPIDYSKLTVAVDAVSGELKDAKTNETTGLIFQKCREVIDRGDNSIKIGSDGYLIGECDSNPECKLCLDSINGAIVIARKESAFSPEEISEPEHIVYFL